MKRKRIKMNIKRKTGDNTLKVSIEKTTLKKRWFLAPTLNRRIIQCLNLTIHKNPPLKKRWESLYNFFIRWIEISLRAYTTYRNSMPKIKFSIKPPVMFRVGAKQKHSPNKEHLRSLSTSRTISTKFRPHSIIT